jgi:DNA transposition AAA+ family ATPase
MNDQEDNSTTPDGIDALISRERVRGSKRVIAEGTDPSNVTAEQIATVVGDAILASRKWKLTHKDVADAVGNRPRVIGDFLASREVANRAQLAIDIDAWLLVQEQTRSRPSVTDFTWTNTATTLKAMASYCQDNRTIGLAYGPDSAGIGKSTAARAIAQVLGPRQCSLVTLTKLDASPTGLISRICAAIGIDTGRGTNRQRQARIIDTLKGRNHLLIVDQIHCLRFALSDKPFYILCDIHDATETTGQLWIGTADLHAYLTRQSAKADESLAQLRSRIFPCIDLLDSMRGNDGGGDLLVTLDQIRSVFARNKMRIVPDAARFLCRLANTPDSGGLRLCVQLVRFANVLAEMGGKTEITLELLRAAMRRGFSSARADAMLSQIENPPAAMVKVG